MSKWIEPKNGLPKEVKGYKGRRSFVSENVFLTCENKNGKRYVIEAFADNLCRPGSNLVWKNVVTCTEITDTVIAWQKIWRPYPFGVLDKA